MTQTELVKTLELEEHPTFILHPEHPWEGHSTYLYGSVIKLEDRYRMYYQSYVDGIGYFVCLAESEDGVSWNKPLVKPLKTNFSELYPTVEVNGKVQDFYRRTNSLECMSNVVSRYHIPSVIYEPGEKYPYKLFGYTKRGYCVAFSKDGINFEEYKENPVIPLLKFPNRRTGKTWFSDVAPVFYDRKENVYRAMVKTYRIDEEGRTRRCIGMSVSRDFIHWTKPRTVWIPSEREDRIAQEKGFKWADFYGLCPFNYEDYYLGFLWLFMIEEEISHGTHIGKIEVYLVRSDDCTNWEFVYDKPVIPLKGWHTGTISTANQPVIEGETIRVYFAGSNFDHGKHEISLLSNSERACIGIGRLNLNGSLYTY